MNAHPTRHKIVYFATQGTGHGEETRITELLRLAGGELLPFDRVRKLYTCWAILRSVGKRRPDLVVMEGTGIAGGFAIISARILFGVPYVVSSGDAVAPYIGIAHPWLKPLALLYERCLCRLSAGYIGWTPYLVGRALTYGAPRGMTAANWSGSPQSHHRTTRRAELGLPPGAIVFGLVGSLVWTSAINYCYGYELVKALLSVKRSDLRVLVIGDGSGLKHLKALAEEDPENRVILTGRVPRDQVMSYLAAIDIASLPQSVDQVGSFRYTTKISEYLSAGLPLVTGQVPLAYDLDDGWIWRLRGDAPWDTRYISDLAELMASITPAELASKQQCVPSTLSIFDRGRQQNHVAQFLTDIINSPPSLL